MMKLFAGFPVAGGVVPIGVQKLALVVFVGVRECGHVKRKTSSVSQTAKRTIKCVAHFVRDHSRHIKDTV